MGLFRIPHLITHTHTTIMAKEKRVRMTTPRLRLKYPRLTIPDTKFNPDGEYGTKGLLDPSTDAAQKFLKQLDKLTDDAFAKMKEEHKKFSKVMTRAATYRAELNDDGDETGLIELGFTMPAKVTAKKGPNVGKTYAFKPALFDAFGQPVTKKDIRIGAGTEAKVSFEFWPYFAPNDKKAGLTKRLVAVQIIKLVEWTGQDAGDFGFSTEDDGFDVSEGAESTTDGDDTEGDEGEDTTGSDF
jgi:hypothetical protein